MALWQINGRFPFHSSFCWRSSINCYYYYYYYCCTHLTPSLFLSLLISSHFSLFPFFIFYFNALCAYAFFLNVFFPFFFFVVVVAVINPNCYYCMQAHKLYYDYHCCNINLSHWDDVGLGSLRLLLPLLFLSSLFFYDDRSKVMNLRLMDEWEGLRVSICKKSSTLLPYPNGAGN